MDKCNCNTLSHPAGYPEIRPTPRQARLATVSEAVEKTPIPVQIRLRIDTKAKPPAHLARLGLKDKTLEALREMLSDPKMVAAIIESPDTVLAELACKLEDPALALVPGARKPAPLSNAVQLTIASEGKS